jgi:hypothetical protein
MMDGLEQVYVIAPQLQLPDKLIMISKWLWRGMHRDRAESMA